MSNVNEAKLFGLLEKYSEKLPYYTSYPTEPHWTSQFSSEDFKGALGELGRSGDPLSLYVHFPYCPTPCLFCHCAIRISQNEEHMEEFLRVNKAEVGLVGEALRNGSPMPVFKDLQLGGGTPSYLPEELFAQYLDNLSQLVNIRGLEEFALEIDPRTVTPDKLRFYQSRGVTRASFGIQDFKDEVQQAVNRVHHVSKIEELLDPEVRSGFDRINFDLIYGLPYQTRESFRETIATAIRFSPDKICVYHYDHRPDQIRHQKPIEKIIDVVPDRKLKSLLFLDAVQALTEAGYEHVGIDHFARPQSDLAQAVRQRTINRNYNGYSAGRTSQLIGLGWSGSSRFLNVYAQNTMSYQDWMDVVGQGRLATAKGYRMSQDDSIRRNVIDSIICLHGVNFAEIGAANRIDFKEYFAQELPRLDALAKDGILDYDGNSIEVTLLGIHFFPQICNVFDRHDHKLERRDGRK